MPKILIHDYRINIKGVKRKIIYHFGDVHLNIADELSSDEEKAEVGKRVENWRNVRIKCAEGAGEPFEDDQLIDATEHLENLLNKSKEDGDALVLAGDIFDYVNSAHLRMFEKRFLNLDIPYVFACGNHEKPIRIPDDSSMALIKHPVQTLDLGDLVIMAFENTQREITREQIVALSKQLSERKPIIIAMHIPIQAEHNDVHGKFDDYYRLNHDGCSKEVLEFIDLIYANADKIPAILSAHLHILNVCELVPGLTQYVSSQGILGNINRYVVGE